ncbi:hypothetical protein [Kitasatospora purpeofusca]|uniref:hypothetical protein n=1 Tax=Kitasatospora purpeofusca TaxID=67352 RepID=UPI003696E0C4
MTGPGKPRDFRITTEGVEFIDFTWTHPESGPPAQYEIKLVSGAVEGPEHWVWADIDGQLTTYRPEKGGEHSTSGGTHTFHLTAIDAQGHRSVPAVASVEL